MFNQLMHYDSDWRRHHRRYMDQASLVRQIVTFCVTVFALVMLLMFFPLN